MTLADILGDSYFADKIAPVYGAGIPASVTFERGPIGLNKWALMHTGVNRARRRAADAKARKAKRRAKRLARIKAARAARKVA